MHVDDGLGVATSEHVVRYIHLVINTVYATKGSSWAKCLGYKVDVSPPSAERPYTMVSLTAPAFIDKMVATFIKGDVAASPKHAMPGSIMHLGPGVTPPTGSPEHGEFLAMQQQCRSLLGDLLWLSRVYPQVTAATNLCCAFMSNPSWEVYKVAKHILLHLHQYRDGTTFGGPGITDLEQLPDAVLAAPAAPVLHTLHLFADASLDTRSVTGAVLMLARGVLLGVCQRQHLASPDVHTSEVSAASTAIACAVVS